jgi:hypothetical protein
MGTPNGQQGQQHQRRSRTTNPRDKPAGNAEKQDATRHEETDPQPNDHPHGDNTADPRGFLSGWRRHLEAGNRRNSLQRELQLGLSHAFVKLCVYSLGLLLLPREICQTGVELRLVAADLAQLTQTAHDEFVLGPGRGKLGPQLILLSQQGIVGHVGALVDAGQAGLKSPFHHCLQIGLLRQQTLDFRVTIGIAFAARLAKLAVDTSERLPIRLDILNLGELEVTAALDLPAQPATRTLQAPDLPCQLEPPLFQRGAVLRRQGDLIRKLLGIGLTKSHYLGLDSLQFRLGRGGLRTQEAHLGDKNLEHLRDFRLGIPLEMQAEKRDWIQIVRCACPQAERGDEVTAANALKRQATRYRVYPVVIGMRNSHGFERGANGIPTDEVAFGRGKKQGRIRLRWLVARLHRITLRLGAQGDLSLGLPGGGQKEKTRSSASESECGHGNQQELVFSQKREQAQGAADGTLQRRPIAFLYRKGPLRGRRARC